jgi:carboxyl-terminal processing protease
MLPDTNNNFMLLAEHCVIDSTDIGRIHRVRFVDLRAGARRVLLIAKSREVIWRNQRLFWKCEILVDQGFWSGGEPTGKFVDFRFVSNDCSLNYHLRFFALIQRLMPQFYAPSFLDSNVVGGELREILTLVKVKYYRKIDLSDCYNRILAKGLSSCLDRWSFYIPAVDSGFYQLARGSPDYIGVGVSLSLKDSVIFLMPLDSVAKAAGVRVGDILLSVDGINVAGLGLEEVAAMLKSGAIGTTAKILVQRGKKIIGPLILVRHLVKNTNVVFEKLSGNIGYIHLRDFTDTSTAANLENALKRLKNEGAKGLIFDLRGNSGGHIPKVREAVGLFSPGNRLAFTSINENNGEILRTSFRKKGDFSDWPVVILVDRSTASGAEIFAATLKVWQIARLVGDTTFGKGVGWVNFELTTGNMLNLTVTEYFIGEDYLKIQGVGVAPDYFVKADKPKPGRPFEDRQLTKGLLILRNLMHQ